MSSSQVRVESSSVKAKDVSNGTQYLIDIQVTVELVGEWSDWGYCKIRLTLFLSKAFSFLINCLQWTQGTIPDIPAGDKSSSGSSSSSSSRRQLSLSSRDSDDDNDDDEEPSIESGMNLLGPTAMLRKAVLSHKERLRAATASMSGFLRQTRHLVAELSDRPKGDTARTSFPSRTLLQTSAGDGSCGGSVNASQVPGANSSIASFSAPTTNCSIQPITSETVIMANILGAVASTASAIKAIQVCVCCTRIVYLNFEFMLECLEKGWQGCQHPEFMKGKIVNCMASAHLSYSHSFSSRLPKLVFYRLSPASTMCLMEQTRSTRRILLL